MKSGIYVFTDNKQAENDQTEAGNQGKDRIKGEGKSHKLLITPK
jgi:hypothetical protein